MLRLNNLNNHSIHNKDKVNNSLDIREEDMEPRQLVEELIRWPISFSK